MWNKYNLSIIFHFSYMKLYKRSEYDAVKNTSLKDKWEKNCPFCNAESQAEYIIWEWKYWYISHNKFPFVGTRKHLLVYPKICKRFTKDIPDEFWSEYPKILAFMWEFYWDESYFSFIREKGEAKSVHHLHYHFLPGELECEPLIDMLQRQWIPSDID